MGWSEPQITLIFVMGYDLKQRGRLLRADRGFRERREVSR